MLSRDLYWLAIALLRLDRSELAIRSLASAQKLRPRSLARLRIRQPGQRLRDGPPVATRARRFLRLLFGSGLHLPRPQAKAAASTRMPRRTSYTKLIGDAWHTLSCSGRPRWPVGLGEARRFQITQDRCFPLFGLQRPRCAERSSMRIFAAEQNSTAKCDAPAGRGSPICGVAAELRPLASAFVSSYDTLLCSTSQVV